MHRFKYNPFTDNLDRIDVASSQIGGDVLDGTANSVLFIDSNKKLAQDNANFFYVSPRLTVGALTIDGGNSFIEDTHGLVIGHTAQIDFGAIPEFQVLGTGTPDASMGFARFENNASGPDVRFLKSRGATIGANTIVSDGDTLGRIRFQGADGNDFNTTAAQMMVKVDGSPALNDIPGKFVWETRIDGGALTEKMSLDNAGVLTIGTLALSDGSITDTSGAISFGNDNIDTTGTIASSTHTIAGITSLVLAPGSITDNGGAISFGDENIDTTGTLASGVATITGVINTSVGLDGVGAIQLNYGSGDITDHKFTSDGGIVIIDGGVTINPSSTSIIGLIVQEAASATADIAQFLTSSAKGLTIETGADGTRGDIIIDTTDSSSDLIIQCGALLELGTNFTDSVTIGRSNLNTRIVGDLEIDEDFNHDGTLIGFFGTAPVVQVSAYTPTNVSTDRVYNANSTSVDELADVLGTLIADLQTYGLLQ